MADKFLSRKEAAEYLTGLGFPIAPKTLANLAGNGGPPYRLWGDMAQYRMSDLEKWAIGRVEEKQ